MRRVELKRRDPLCVRVLSHSHSDNRRTIIIIAAAEDTAAATSRARAGGCAPQPDGLVKLGCGEAARVRGHGQRHRGGVGHDASASRACVGRG